MKRWQQIQEYIDKDSNIYWSWIYVMMTCAVYFIPYKKEDMIFMPQECSFYGIRINEKVSNRRSIEQISIKYTKKKKFTILPTI